MKGLGEKSLSWVLLGSKWYKYQKDHIMLKLLIIALSAAALGIAGCEAVETEEKDPQGYSWKRDKDDPRASQTDRTVHIVAPGNIYFHCNNEENAKSCAVLRKQDDTSWFCDIYLPKGYEEWQLAHEHRHCDGWSHPGKVLKMPL
jgi:hypothetical protein